MIIQPLCEKVQVVDYIAILFCAEIISMFTKGQVLCWVLHQDQLLRSSSSFVKWHKHRSISRLRVLAFSNWTSGTQLVTSIAEIRHYIEKQEQEKIMNNQSIKIMFKTWYKNIGFLIGWGCMDLHGTYSTALKTSLRKKMKEGKHLFRAVIQVHMIPWQWSERGAHAMRRFVTLLLYFRNANYLLDLCDFNSTHTLFQLMSIGSGTEKEVCEKRMHLKILVYLSILALQLVSNLLHIFWPLCTNPTDFKVRRFWRY